EEGEDHQMVSNVIASAEHEQIDIIGQILAANEEEEGEGNEILRHAQSIIDKFGGSSHKSSSSHSSRSSDVALRDISALLGDSPVLLKVKEKIGAEAEMEGQSSIFSAENNASDVFSNATSIVESSSPYISRLSSLQERERERERETKEEDDRIIIREREITLMQDGEEEERGREEGDLFMSQDFIDLPHRPTTPSFSNLNRTKSLLFSEVSDGSSIDSIQTNPLIRPGSSIGIHDNYVRLGTADMERQFEREKEFITEEIGKDE
ncbi:hypothetical protein ADUPG1_010481, partial [Aduncisulcus paluster]